MIEVKSNIQNIFLFIILGVLIGSLTANQITSNRYQQIINEKNNQIQVLNSSVSDYLLNITEKSEQISYLTNDLEFYRSQITMQESYLETATLDIQDAQDEIIDLKQQVRNLEVDNKKLEEEIENYEDHIDELYSLIEVSEENALYIDHSVYFEYPRSMNLTESGRISDEACEFYGEIYLGGSNETSNYFSLTWDFYLFNFTLDEINMIILEELIKESKHAEFKYQFQESQEDMINGHNAITTKFTYIIGSQTLHGRLSLWFCEDKNRLYNLFMIFEGDDVDSFFKEFISSLDCHFE